MGADVLAPSDVARRGCLRFLPALSRLVLAAEVVVVLEVVLERRFRRELLLAAFFGALQKMVYVCAQGPML